MNAAVSDREEVSEILSREFNDRIYTVEDDVIWVSGTNAHCATVARKMARMLAHCHDIPTSLVYDDDAVAHGGVQFNWGESA
ncbi:hypothetical protein C437_15331 [Haloarcula vallismortis ATCC 29715]|uniref:Uncharacterized protein n=1 Tax=Haloarcula vallismortis ATCC 29715 TaxID=662477 RepID=M0J196_HALVA|nr:hypothetical protein [Haloarcula vallismortis]EMA01804.1 hypothetical protein C437_15331 [Haloarcula vallismortis ATCC 29715]